MSDTQATQWQRDPQTGKWYREIGHIREYEMEYMQGGVSVPEHIFRENIKRDKERAVLKQIEQPEHLPSCPFKGGIVCTCDKTCALYNDGCIATKATAAYDTKGRKCPFEAGTCRETCAFYHNGCVLTTIIK